MPLIPGFEKSFFSTPNSGDIDQLNARWRAGEFAMRIFGLLIQPAPPDIPALLFIAEGDSLQAAGNELAMITKPPSGAFFTQNIEWNSQA